MNQPVALITGGNRGLGRETARQLAAQGYHVLLGSRDLELGRAIAEELAGSVEAVELDVTSDRHTTELRGVVERCGRLDALVNNAGITGGTRYATSILDLDLTDLAHVMDVNVMGALRVAAAVVPIMRERGRGCIVNVSSGMGQLSDMGKGAPAYRLSKTALNAFTRVLSRELADTAIKVNSVCPGWVRTDLGGPNASLAVEEGVRGIVWAATLPADGPTGGFFRHGKAIAW
ncbi:MAG TPA: SDR family NAD(P)-dependent oxidoreductase [Polyangiaceae bacterium]|nr:SDR family NAD(P)-dependent oxidoreductase [Polyangiaceae bacterium]